MSEQFFVFALQMSILFTVAAVVSFYLGIAILNLAAYTYIKLKDLFHTAVKQADDLGANVAQISSKPTNTKIMGV